MKHLCLSLGLLAVTVFLTYSPAGAQQRDQSFKDWTVYTTELDGKRMCYIASFPKSKTGNYKRRDEPYFLVTRISDNVHEVSTSSGYKYKENSKIKATVGGDTFYLSLIQGERAWARDSKVDKNLIDRMKSKNYMNIKGTSVLGTYSVDKYSLSGFTAAHKRMKDLCG